MIRSILLNNFVPQKSLDLEKLVMASRMVKFLIPSNIKIELKKSSKINEW